VYGISNLAGGKGVYGLATGSSGASYGVHGESYATAGRGVYGQASGTGQSTGVYGLSSGTTGRGVYAINNASSGNTYGLSAWASSPDGAAVYGYAADSTGGDSYGVYGEANSNLGWGVYGISETMGVVGRFNQFNGFGVFSYGTLGASGPKAFRIDHPDNPENKYLLHYASESPEVTNFYSGTITLDGAGTAQIDLPHYFAKVNKDPRYTLTAVGAPMPLLHIATEIDPGALATGAEAGPADPTPACWFRVAGGVPGGKVSWRVEAVRNDEYVQQRGAPVEVDKPEWERGTYQHPDLYGQPVEKAIKYRPSPTADEAPTGGKQ
jgi:hypothetical protein